MEYSNFFNVRRAPIFENIVIVFAFVKYIQHG